MAQKYTCQNNYNAPHVQFTGNYSTGNITDCSYNSHLDNLTANTNAVYTIRSGNSIRIGVGSNAGAFNNGASFHAFVDPNYNLANCSNTSNNIEWDYYFTGDGSIVRYKKPLNFQLYPRKSNNYGDVEFSATVNGISSLNIKVTKTAFNNAVTSNIYPVTITNNRFNHTIPIHAELSEYKFEYQINGSGAWILIADNVVCGDAYVISGQSNAETKDLTLAEKNYLNKNFGIGEFDANHILIGGPNQQFGKYSRSYGGTWTHNGGWGRSIVSNGTINDNSFSVGAWGLVIQHNIQKDYGIPTAIINGAVGGTSIQQHLPYTGEYFHNPVSNPTLNNRFFSHLNSRIYFAGLENNIKGVFWLQGDGNGAGSSNNSYISQFTPLYNLWSQFFNAFSKTYIIQIHSWVEPGTNNLNENDLRICSEEQKNLPSFFSNLSVMSMNGIGFHRVETGHEIHHQDQGYIELGNRLFRLLEVDFYGKTTNINDIYPPQIQGAVLSGNQITLQFNQNLSISNSDDLNNVLSVIKFNTGYLTKTNPVINGNSLTFNVSNPSGITHVSYAGFIPNALSPINPDFPCYIKNSKNIAAYSFHNFPVTQGEYQKTTYILNNSLYNLKESFIVYPNPFQNKIIISNEFGEPINSIKIFDIAGKLIYAEDDIKKTEFGFELNPGVYILEINNNPNQKIKIIKTNN